MNSVITVTVIVALIGSALIGGIFFAFSCFIMKALARLPSREGIAAMQSINVVVLNPLFFVLFIGTAIISLFVSILSIIGWEMPASPYYLTAAVIYLVGTFLVTGMGNVPLNNQLASITVNDSVANDLWQHYLVKWTRLNTIRTASATVAALIIVIGLLK